MRIHLALLLCLAASSGFSQDIPAKADTYVKRFSDKGRFMGSVLIARDGRILFEKGYGLANAEWNITNDPHTRFRLGSITKQFTATAILQLAEQGKLSVSDPVSKYYTDAPASWSRITIHHLLTHTSGIPSYTGLPDFFPKRSMAPMTPAEIVKLTQDMPLEFEPGTKHKYDNTGYILLGYIIEKVSGMKYAEYLQKNVFDPAGMTETGYDLAQTVIPHRAAGYSGDAKHLSNARYLDMTLPYAAGSLYSTVEDLAKWDQALYTDKLLTAKSRELMYTPSLDNYAYGWVVSKRGARLRYEHNGGINGFNTVIARFPEEKMVVVVLSNLESPLPSRMADDLAGIVFGETIQFPGDRPEVALSTTELDRFAGRYQIAPDRVFHIQREGSHLTGAPANQKPLPLKAIGASTFYVDGPDAEIEFTRDAQGSVTGMKLKQGSQEQVAKRVQ